MRVLETDKNNWNLKIKKSLQGFYLDKIQCMQLCISGWVFQYMLTKPQAHTNTNVKYKTFIQIIFLKEKKCQEKKVHLIVYSKYLETINIPLYI